MRVVMPIGPRTLASPMPESCSKAGVWMAPAARMTSRLAFTMCREEPPPEGANVTPEATSGRSPEFFQVMLVT